MRLSPLLQLAAVALAAASMPGHAAEWTQLPGPASTGATVYTDVASERSRHGKVVGYLLPNPRQAWFLTDYATPHRWKLFQISSSKQLIEFDCKRSSMRLLARLFYEGAMAQGRLLASETPAAEFTMVVPGDMEESMQQSACRPPPAETVSGTHPAAAVPTMATASPSAPLDAPVNPPDTAAAAVTADGRPEARQTPPPVPGPTAQP